jgi:hypothetical protein
MDAATLTNLGYGILNFLVIIPALWIAGRLLPVFLAWIGSRNLRPLLSHSLPRTACGLGRCS